MTFDSRPLSDENLTDVVAFMRRANPFAQHTWGWDTGRFVDWRWGGNTLRESESPGWFADHCAVFRDGNTIRALAIAEYGRADVCVVTPGEDPAAIRFALRYLVAQRNEAELNFEVLDDPTWLTSIFQEVGFVERSNTGNEWEYELATAEAPVSVPDGFSIETLGDDRSSDYDGITECIRQAFNSTHDVAAALSSLESNPMFRPELSVFIRSPDGRIAAYCRGTVDPDNGICGIDPVCTHPDFQRMGLGTAAVRSCFDTQRQLGGKFSYIGSAPEPAPGTHLYRALGPSSVAVYSSWSRPGSGATS